MADNESNPVLTLEVDDQISPGAAAAAAALDAVGNSATVTETKVTRLTTSAAALVSRLDPVARAQAALASQGAILAQGLAAGSITADQYSDSMATLQQRVTAAGNAHAVTEGTIAGVGGQTRATTMLIRDATGAFAELSAGMSPLAVAAAHMGNLEHATETFGEVAKQAFAFVTSGPGIAIAAVAVFGAIAYAAENATSRLTDLRTALSAVNADPVATSAVADQASRAIASAGTASLADATTAATALLNQPSVVQSTANIERLIIDSNNLAVVFGVTLPQEAAKLAAAMDAPGKMAQELATNNFKGMNDQLATTIERMADSGDKAGAFALLLGAIEKAVNGAADASKTELQKALDDLKGSFVGTGASSDKFGSALGTDLLHNISQTVEGIASLVNAIKNLYAEFSTVSNALGLGFNIPIPSWMSGIPATGGSSGSAPNPFVQFLTSGAYGNGSTPGTPASIAPMLSAAAAQYNVDPALLARLQAAEGVQNADGTWQTSSTGAIGPMQVLPSTFNGIIKNPAQYNAPGLTDVTDPGQNVTAGTALLSQLLTHYAQYGSDGVMYAIAAYHDGQTVVDKAITTGNLGLISTDAANETSKVLTGYGGNGFGGGAANITPGTAIDVGGTGAATVNDPNKVIDDALAAAKSGSTANTLATATDNVTKYTAALAALKGQGVTTGASVDILTEALTKAQHAQSDALGPAAKLIQGLQDQTNQQNELAAAYTNGFAAEALAVDQVKAEQQARTIAAPGTVAYTQAVVALTAANTALSVAQENVAGAKAIADQGQQLQYIQAETASIGQAAESRAVSLATLKEQQTIQASMPLLAQNEKDQLVAGAAAIAQQNFNLQQTQQALADVGNLATQAFDQVGQAISQAFVNGQGAAVNWGNVARSVVSSVIQEIAKLAILNPIINSITGGSATTLGGVISALSSSPGAGGTTTGAGSSAFSTLSNIGTVGSAANTLSGGSLLQALGITGPNGLSTTVGNLLPNSITSLFSSGATVSAASSDAALANAIAGAGPINSGLLGSGGSLAGLANTSLGLGTATIGTALTGVGGGFGIGSLAGSLEQGALNKVGPAPTIGAGVGAVAGAAIGSVIPGVGTVIGGLVGGLIGGAGGGLIGPHPASSFSSTKVGITSGGGLAIGDNLSQLDPNNLTEFNQAEQDAATLNALLSQAGISLASLGGISQLGDNSAKGFKDPSKASDLASAFPGLRFSVNDTSTEEGADLAPLVNGQSFASAGDLQAVFTEVDTFVNQTLPSLTVITPNIGSMATSIGNLNTAFGPALIEANKLNDGVQALTDSYNTQLATINSAVAAQVQSDQVGFQSQYAAAAAQISGSPQDAENAALFTFDNITVPQARQQLAAEYQGIFGDAYASTSQYVATSATLEQSLGEQRLAIQSQYNAQIAAADGTAATSQAQALATAQQTAESTVASLESYVQKLQGSSDSPLSPQAQYALAQSQFNAVAGAASAGDANSIGQLPTFGDALLSASRTVNGSGAAYATDYNSVLSAVGSVASMGTDALTNAFMAAQLQSQTDAIVSSIQSLQTTVAGLQTALSQAALQPSRIAA